MPLLRKANFERTNDVLELMKDDDQVFFCEITGELFSNYEEYCERIILANSMVWTCSMTGKSNLTYAEALKSEQDAAATLKDFPPELRVPILYLASQTKRKNLKDMLEDVFLYAKDNYFIGEHVQILINDEWLEAKVISVKESPKKAKDNSKITPGNYTYEAKVRPKGQKNTKTYSLKSIHMQRKKGSFTRPKSKLFLKQHVEQADGIFRIKDAALKKYKVDEIKFSDIFVGDNPVFSSGVSESSPSNKGQKQESIAKYLTKSDGQKIETSKMNGDAKSLKNKPFAMKKTSEEIKQKILNDKKSLKEKRDLEKMNVKDMEAHLQKFIKQWNQTKEDLELTDQRVMPIPHSIDTFISNKKFGEFIAILEFLETFSEELNLKESFPQGVTWDILERALTLKEINGPLHDIFQLLLLYIFGVLSSEFSANSKSARAPPPKFPSPEEGTLAAHVEHATTAMRFAYMQFGATLVSKQVDAVTLSEILRLHLLSSGSRVRENLMRYRSNNRGGYDGTDDPGLQLRISQPHILKALSMYNICQLPQSDILTLLTCLMNQILTYVPIREIVEKRIEASSKAKFELRVLQATHRKTVTEYAMNKQKCMKELETEQSRENQKALEVIEKEHADYLQNFTEKCDELLRIQFSHEIYLGSDRCHRRYWLFESVPGLFVENDEQHAGSCLTNIIPQHPILSTCELAEYEKNLKKIFREQYKINDKENIDVAIVTSENSSVLDTNSYARALELQMCSSDNKACRIHGDGEKILWSFFYTKEEIDLLISSLNKRGVRERPLLNNLKQWRELIYDHVESCPVERLNKTMIGLSKNLRPKMKYHENDTNLNHPPGTDASIILRDTLVEFILELYDKISMGCLGKLQVNDVESWQDSLRAGEYDMHCDELSWCIQHNKKFVKKKNGEIFTVMINNKEEEKEENDDEEKGSDDDDDLETISEATSGDYYFDPGCSLGPTADIDSEDSEDEAICALHESSEQKEQLHNLACALLQVAQSVEAMNLQSPFGGYNARSGYYSAGAHQKAKARYRKWETSLMNATSYAQIFSHYHAFEQSIIWSNSIQYASCKVCKRKTKPEQMLLCDKCNCAIHTYCIEPTLKKIPAGDWYCSACKPLTEQEKLQSNRRRRNNRMIKDESAENNDDEPARKRRKQIDYDSMTNGDDSGLDVSRDISNGIYEDKTSRTKNNKRSSIDTFTVCNACKSGGIMITCDSCQLSWHVECVVPALRRAPRGKWSCTKCTKGSRKNEMAPANNQHHMARRCASLCRKRILGYAQILSREALSDDDGSDSSDDTTLPVRKSRRTNEKDSSLGAVAENSFSIPSGQELDQLLGDIGRHKDSWPFMSPVTLEEVPDYFDIIEKPMDFGTIRSKLKYGEYTGETEVLADIALVFENCDTYNNGQSDVYKAGARLLKYVLKRGQELNFEFPESVKDGFVE